MSRGAKRKLEEEVEKEVDDVAGEAGENKNKEGTASGAGEADGDQAVIEIDDAKIAKALEEEVEDEVEEEDAAKDSEDEDYVPTADDEQNAFLAEERRMRAENKRKAEEERKARKSMSEGEKTEQLNNLLQKAAAYTAFLRQRMQEGNSAEGGGKRCQGQGGQGREGPQAAQAPVGRDDEEVPGRWHGVDFIAVGKWPQRHPCG